MHADARRVDPRSIGSVSGTSLVERAALCGAPLLRLHHGGWSVTSWAGGGAIVSLRIRVRETGREEYWAGSFGREKETWCEMKLFPRNLFARLTGSLKRRRKVKCIFFNCWIKYTLDGTKPSCPCGCRFDWGAENEPPSPVRRTLWSRNWELYLAERWQTRIKDFWKLTVTKNEGLDQGDGC